MSDSSLVSWWRAELKDCDFYWILIIITFKGNSGNLKPGSYFSMFGQQRHACNDCNVINTDCQSYIH